MAAEMEAMREQLPAECPTEFAGEFPTEPASELPGDWPAFDDPAADSTGCDNPGPDIDGIELLLARKNLTPKARTTLKSLRAALNQTASLKKAALEKRAQSEP